MLTGMHHCSLIICSDVPAASDMTRCLRMITLHGCNRLKCCFVWWCSSCRCWPSPHASSTLSSHATTMQSCTLTLQPAASSLTSTSPSSPCSCSPSLVRCVHVQGLLRSQCCNVESCYYTVLLRLKPLTLQKAVCMAYLELATCIILKLGHAPNTALHIIVDSMSLSHKRILLSA